MSEKFPAWHGISATQGVAEVINTMSRHKERLFIRAISFAGAMHYQSAAGSNVAKRLRHRIAASRSASKIIAIAISAIVDGSGTVEVEETVATVAVE